MFCNIMSQPSDPRRASRDWWPALSAGGWMNPPFASSAPHSRTFHCLFSPFPNRKPYSFSRHARQLPVIYQAISDFVGFFILYIEALSPPETQGQQILLPGTICLFGLIKSLKNKSRNKIVVWFGGFCCSTPSFTSRKSFLAILQSQNVHLWVIN